MSSQNRRVLIVVTIAAAVFGIFFGPKYYAQYRTYSRLRELEAVSRDDIDENRRPISILILSNRPVTNADMRSLHAIRPIHRLYLFATSIDDDGVAGLIGMDELEWLNIAETKITDKSMSLVTQLPNLKNLNLRKSNVTNQGLLQLKGATRLEFLDVEFTPVTKEGVDALRKLLPSLKFVHPFDTPPDDD